MFALAMSAHAQTPQIGNTASGASEPATPTDAVPESGAVATALAFAGIMGGLVVRKRIAR